MDGLAVPVNQLLNMEGSKQLFEFKVVQVQSLAPGFQRRRGTSSESSRIRSIESRVRAQRVQAHT